MSISQAPYGHIRARQIMGSNFFGVEEVIQAYGVKPTTFQLQHLSRIPWRDEELEEWKDSHFLIAVFPLSIIFFRDFAQNPDVPRNMFDPSNYWSYPQDLVRDAGPAAWHLIRKKAVVNPTSNEWYVQRNDLLAPDENVSSVQVMFYAMFSYFLLTAERLFEDVYVRCSEKDSDGDDIFVRFGPHGIHLFNFTTNARQERFGVAAEKSY